MNNQDILQQFERINTWKSRGVRAPHKPLLMLLALGEIQRGNTGFIPYSTVEPRLKELLIDFGPPRKTIYTSFPFIRLVNDDLWQFNKPEIINTKQDYSNKYLLNHDLQGEKSSESVPWLAWKLPVQEAGWVADLKDFPKKHWQKLNLLESCTKAEKRQYQKLPIAWALAGLLATDILIQKHKKAIATASVLSHYYLKRL